jgi:hypothetical protein
MIDNVLKKKRQIPFDLAYWPGFYPLAEIKLLYPLTLAALTKRLRDQHAPAIHKETNPFGRRGRTLVL